MTNFLRRLGLTSEPTSRVLPMQLQPGDRFTDEEGEWEIAVLLMARADQVIE